MTLRDGARVNASVAWNSKTWHHEFEIVGTEAKVNWLPYDKGPVVKTVGRQVENLELPCADNVHLPLVESFVNAIRENQQPEFSFAEAIKTNILLDAVYRSARENREVTVNS